MDISVTLHQLGLTDKEALVYLATLEIGMAPISVIAKKSKLRRSTAYEILKKLSEKGIAEFFVRKSTRYYSVIPPKLLVEKFRSSLIQLEKALPEMLAISNQIVHKPRITFYEGKEDIARLYLDVLTAKGEIRNYFLPEAMFRYFSREWLQTEIIEKLVELKKQVRVIMPDSTISRTFLKERHSDLRQQRLIAQTKMQFKNEMAVYDNKVVSFSFEEDFAFLIESRDVAELQSVIFDLAWESALLKF